MVNTNIPNNLGLGRIYKEDFRDKTYQISSLLPKQLSTKTYKYWWSSGWWGNQGNTPQCVGYSWVHWLADGPITQPNKVKNTKIPYLPANLYHEAQLIDEWPGVDYEGTSVRAAAKVLKREGYISTYNWAWDIETLKNALLNLGPVVVGTTWTFDMFYPDDKGIIKATGSVAGGHAYLLDGINTSKKLIRIKNSWGRNWGKNGFAYISFDDMETLINDDGEVCLAQEIQKVSK